MKTHKPSIIVEGPNASGKSTLVNKLADHYGTYAFKAGPRPLDNTHSEICMIYQTHWLFKYPCVWDRFTGISNICNPPIIEDPKELQMHASYLSAALQGGVVIVICTADNFSNHVPEKYESAEDIELATKAHKHVYNNYIRMAHDLSGAIAYDFNVMEFDMLIRRIDHEFSRHLSRSSSTGKVN